MKDRRYNPGVVKERLYEEMKSPPINRIVDRAQLMDFASVLQELLAAVSTGVTIYKGGMVA